MTHHEKLFTAYESIDLEVAMAESAQMPTTPTIQRLADRLGDFSRAEVARVRGAERKATTLTGHVRAAIRAMSDEAVKLRLFELFTTHRNLQVAFRDSTGNMSENDRRTLLEDVLSMLDLME